jgi:hypothetical protein
MHATRNHISLVVDHHGGLLDHTGALLDLQWVLQYCNMSTNPVKLALT